MVSLKSISASICVAAGTSNSRILDASCITKVCYQQTALVDLTVLYELSHDIKLHNTNMLLIDDVEMQAYGGFSDLSNKSRK